MAAVRSVPRGGTPPGASFVDVSLESGAAPAPRPSTSAGRLPAPGPGRPRSFGSLILGDVGARPGAPAPPRRDRIEVFTTFARASPSDLHAPPVPRVRLRPPDDVAFAEAGGAPGAPAAPAGEAKLLRFAAPRAGGAGAAPGRLTTRVVPRCGDAAGEYCGGCVFADMDRCAYCGVSKLSATHRLQIERLSALLLLGRPRMSGRDLGRALARYARSDDFSAALNERLGWDAPPRKFCRAHGRDRAARGEELHAKNVALHDLRAELAAALARAGDAEAAAARAAAEADELQHELLARDIARQEDEERLAAVVAERDALRRREVNGPGPCPRCAARDAVSRAAAATQTSADDVPEDAAAAGDADAGDADAGDAGDGAAGDDGADGAGADAGADAGAGAACAATADAGCQCPEDGDGDDGAAPAPAPPARRGSLARRASSGRSPSFLARPPALLDGAVADAEGAAAPLPLDGSAAPPPKKADVRRRKMKGLVHVAAGNMSLDALQETIYDIWEKKTQADEVCRRGGVEAGALDLYVKQYSGQEKRAKFPTSKAPISAVFHSFRLIFGRAIISRNGLEAWMLSLERARAEHSR